MDNCVLNREFMICLRAVETLNRYTAVCRGVLGSKEIAPDCGAVLFSRYPKNCKSKHGLVTKLLCFSASRAGCRLGGEALQGEYVCELPYGILFPPDEKKTSTPLLRACFVHWARQRKTPEIR